MSDLYHSAGSVGISRYRANTDKLATMAGVTRTPSRDHCICCGKMRTAATGKHNRAGKFVCGMCLNPRKVL